MGEGDIAELSDAALGRGFVDVENNRIAVDARARRAGPAAVSVGPPMSNVRGAAADGGRLGGDRPRHQRRRDHRRTRPVPEGPPRETAEASGRNDDQRTIAAEHGRRQQGRLQAFTCFANRLASRLLCCDRALRAVEPMQRESMESMSRWSRSIDRDRASWRGRRRTVTAHSTPAMLPYSINTWSPTACSASSIESTGESSEALLRRLCSRIRRSMSSRRDSRAGSTRPSPAVSRARCATVRSSVSIAASSASVGRVGARQ